ncbi:MAG: hypothetical protein L3V56_10215 [Candidatus Magnetoovum sp. WYHC-5]|nr:hypothetical protein [Candidatus Magnetoovum sp. WYHC-5]
MKIDIKYSDNAIKFLNNNKSILPIEKLRYIVISAVKKLLKIEDSNINLKCLKGKFKGYYRIRTRKIRIIFSLKENTILIVFVHKIGYRNDIYK